MTDWGSTTELLLSAVKAAAVPYFSGGGWLMAPLALLMFLIWNRYLHWYIHFRRALQDAETCIREVETRMTSEESLVEIAEALEPCRGMLPRLVRHALVRMRFGIPFREAFAQCREIEAAEYSHSFYMLSAFVAAAPLLGLLGTVLGMIETFHGVAGTSYQTGTAVASGVSQALITTQVGLAAALPGAFGLAHLHRISERIGHTVDRCESRIALVLESDQAQNSESEAALPDTGDRSP